MSGPIVLLGASGYLGQAMEREILRRGWPCEALARARVDYTKFQVLADYLRSTKPAFLVNAAGFTGKPNVDACELAKADTLQGNTLFPQMVAHACAVTNTPWGHISSGCIYNGAKVIENGGVRVEKDLTRPEIRALLDLDRGAIRGFTEEDEPNFSFRQPPCSFYSGTKALAEEAITGIGSAYVWRLRIPFDEFDNARNYLSKLQRYARLYDNVNSISHRGEFAKACLDLWEKRAPFGTYNITNPGFVTTRQVVERIQRVLKPARAFEFWANDEEFYRVAARTPRSNCVLDVTKLQSAGVKLRPVEEALEESLIHWRKE